MVMNISPSLPSTLWCLLLYNFSLHNSEALHLLKSDLRQLLKLLFLLWSFNNSKSLCPKNFVIFNLCKSLHLSGTSTFYQADQSKFNKEAKHSIIIIYKTTVKLTVDCDKIILWSALKMTSEQLFIRWFAVQLVQILLF